MSVLSRASIGYLFRHPWQLVLAVLGVAVGVAVIVAVDLANQSSRNAFISSMNTLNCEATHQVVAGPGGVDETLYVQLRVDAGIRSIAPIVSGYVQVNDRTLQLLGVDLFAEREFRSFSSSSFSPVGNAAQPGNTAATGSAGIQDLLRTFLSGNNQVLMSTDTAQDLGLGAGDSFDLIANGKNHTATVAGLSGGDSAGGVSSLLIADISTAQYWLEMQGRLSRIDVKIPAANAELETTLRANLRGGAELLNAAGRTQSTVDMSEAFMTNLFAMSLLALLVGLFLIYNSVAFAVLQRRGLIGILRALGVTRLQVFRLVVSEAAIIGVVGATLGVLAGIWLGEKLLVLVSRAVSDHYFVVNVTNVTIGWMSVAKGMLAGLGATLVAAAVPALEASSYRPRLALSRSVLETRISGALPKLAFAGMLLGLAAMGLLWFSGSNLVAGLNALFLLILGFALCIPLFVRQASVLLVPFAGRIAGATGRLAVSGVGKSLSRTGVAVVALSIAVSATIGVSIMVESFRTSVSDWLNNTLQSDVYVGVPRGALDPELIEQLVAAPGITAYSTSRRSWLENAEGRTRLIALQMAPGSYAGTTLRGGDEEAVWQQFDEQEAVLISDSYAYRSGLSRGDRLEINTADGRRTFNIAAVFQSYDSNDGAILMNRATYDRYFDDPAVDSLGIYLQEGFAAEELMDVLRATSVGKQSLVMSSNARIREISLQIFDRTFVITNVLYWLAVGVAIVGILGAMLALQLERSREFGVLRAIGMTPGQTGFLVTAQTGFIGLLSGIAAVPLGLVMAFVLIEVINRRAFGWEIDFTIPPGVLIWALVLAVGAALVAGVYPAWSAAVGRPALAMREE